jgi:hypothetical protein
MAAEETHLAPGAAPAALEGAHAGTAPAEHGGGGGLPQFDFQYWGGQIVWLLLIFSVLYFLMARVFIPRKSAAPGKFRGRPSTPSRFTASPRPIAKGSLVATSSWP